MGRFKQRDIIIREFDDITIVIANRNTIWMLPHRGLISVVFHRWFGPLDTWQNWRRFRERMRANKKLTMLDVYRLANRWEIASQGSTRPKAQIMQEIIESTQQPDSRRDGRKGSK